MSAKPNPLKHLSPSLLCFPLLFSSLLFSILLPSLFLSLLIFSISPMADRDHRDPRSTANNNLHNGSTFLRNLQAHAPNSTRLLGLLAFIISGSILLLLSGITVTAAVLALIFFTPLIILSSPIWLPAGMVLVFSLAGFLSVCGFFVAVVGGSSWMYRYFRGLNPPGSDRFDYARNRIYDTASHVKDYAREYGGYLQSKVKDAAPGA